MKMTWGAAVMLWMWGCWLDNLFVYCQLCFEIVIPKITLSHLHKRPLFGQAGRSTTN